MLWLTYDTTDLHIFFFNAGSTLLLTLIRVCNNAFAFDLFSCLGDETGTSARGL